MAARQQAVTGVGARLDKAIDLMYSDSREGSAGLVRVSLDGRVAVLRSGQYHYSRTTGASKGSWSPVTPVRVPCGSMAERNLFPTRKEFAKWVREALNRLYDSPYLQSHRLASLLANEGRGAALRRSQDLRRVLLDAIQAMRPGSGVPAGSPDWRAYRILELRYIEGLSPNEVMGQLALGRSQYFRDQARVVEMLVDTLWPRAQENAVAGRAGDDTSRQELAQSETERLCAQATWEPVDAAALLDDLRAVVAPLARNRGSVVRFALPHRLTVPSADRVMLRQAVLGLVTHALDVAPRGQVELRGFTDRGGVGVRVVAQGPTGAVLPREDGPGEELGLEVCRQLVEAMGGRLRLERGHDRWEARLAWPAAEPCVLLVVDDNESFVDLFHRYLVGHNWQVVGATSGTEARQIIADTRPTVIALDVMMPKEDGWEFLMALKADPSTRDLPVIVCSVLSEPQLALTLGAVDYLPKPVAQEALLQALARWA